MFYSILFWCLPCFLLFVPCFTMFSLFLSLTPSVNSCILCFALSLTLVLGYNLQVWALSWDPLATMGAFVSVAFCLRCSRSLAPCVPCDVLSSWCTAFWCTVLWCTRQWPVTSATLRHFVSIEIKSLRLIYSDLSDLSRTSALSGFSWFHRRVHSTSGFALDCSDSSNTILQHLNTGLQLINTRLQHLTQD